jgi:uncharacterized repeat protein (TIGR01451 family)
VERQPDVLCKEFTVLQREMLATASDMLPRRDVMATTAPDKQRRAMLRSLCALLWLFGSAQIEAADEASRDLDIVLVAEVRADVEVSPGRRVTRLVPATALRQGQEIFYTVRIRNTTTVPARDVEVVQRIPQNTVYVPHSAAGPGADIALSADGGQTFGREGELTVFDQSAIALMRAPHPDRATLTRPAMPQDYTHIRWHLRNALAPGAVALARFRAVFR